MDTKRFLELVQSYDKLHDDWELQKGCLLIQDQLEPDAKLSKRYRKQIHKLQTRMDHLESTIIDFVQDTNFVRNFKLQRRLGNERLAWVENYFQYERPAWYIQLDDGTELGDCMRWPIE